MTRAIFLTAFFVTVLSLGGPAQAAAPPAAAAGWPVVFAPPASLTDFSTLFTATDQWKGALSQISAIEMTTTQLSAETDAQLADQIAFLRAHNLRLDIVIPVQPSMFLAVGCEHPQVMVEQSRVLGQRLRQLNAPVGNLVWDEPLAYGYDDGQRAADASCHYTLEDLALQTVYITQAFVESYQGAKIGVVETEPVCGLGGAAVAPADPAACPTPSLADLNQWLDDLTTLDTKPKLFRLQVQWNRAKPGHSWREAAGDMVMALKARGIGYGQVVDALQTPTMTDADWTAAAESGSAAWYDAFSAAPPREAVITTWFMAPSRLLPESDPATLTSVIDWYCGSGPWAGNCGPAPVATDSAAVAGR